MNNIILPPTDWEQNIIQHFQPYGLESYVCFHPFVRLPEGVTLDDYYESQDLRTSLRAHFRNPKNFISWHKLIKEFDFPSIAYMNEVLLAGDAIRRSARFDYDKLLEDSRKLHIFLKSQEVNVLFESDFPPEYELAFLESLLYMGYDKAIFADEFGDECKEINLREQMSLIEQNRVYLHHEKSICTPDLKISYTVSYDCYFTVLAAEKDLLKKILDTYQFDGFYPDESTTYLL